MTDRKESSKLNYTDLQKSVDELVGKYGLAKAIQLLRHFSDNAKIPVKDTYRLKLITDYIISECLSEFNLDAEQFNTSTIREYREARMACYHLLKKYTDSSYSRIGQHFGWPIHTIYYFCQKCTEMLSLSEFYKPFVNKYKHLEESTISFISRLK